MSEIKIVTGRLVGFSKDLAVGCPFCGGGIFAQARRDGKGFKKPSEICRHFVEIVSPDSASFRSLPSKFFWTDPQGAGHTVTIKDWNPRMSLVEYFDNTRRHGNGRYATRKSLWVYNTELREIPENV